MHSGQVVCLLHPSVLSPFYHRVEMGGGLRWPIISLHLAYLEHVAVSEKGKNTAIQMSFKRECMFIFSPSYEVISGAR